MTRLRLVRKIGLGVMVGTSARHRKQRIRPIRRAQILGFFEALPRGRVLDAPSGSLWLTRALAARGFEVHAIDRLDPDVDSIGGCIHCLRSDLNDGLAPFADGTFDYVISIEGLEHLERPALLLREFARVLKRHGLLLLTTPNISSLRSRLKFLLFGYFDGFRRRTLFRRLGRTAPETGHIMPVHLQFLYYWLTDAGFTHIEVYAPIHDTIPTIWCC